ncbi:MAG: hypothetical protein ACT4QD_07905 [Acidobacteriota bacterium]
MGVLSAAPGPGLPAAPDTQVSSRTTTEARGPSLDVLIDRLDRYLRDYEAALGAVVADERYDQFEESTDLRRGLRRRTTRRLDSEVAFLRLPGDREWFGIRDVFKVNGGTLRRGGPALVDLLSQPGAATIEKAKAIVDASARHNLTAGRTINMPTVPLEILSARDHRRVEFTLGGDARVRGVATRRLEFVETATPTFIRTPDGAPLWSHGAVWIEPNTGQVWQVELFVGPEPLTRLHGAHLDLRMRVEFRREAVLDLMVPTTLDEDFPVPAGRGGGRARYSNFRRFTTSARILPP